MRGDEEIAKAVVESLMAEGARGRRPEDDKDDSLEGSRGNGDNPCGASNGQRRSSCEEVADHLFELLDAQMPLEAAARLRRHCETCPHCSELAEAEIHVRNRQEVMLLGAGARQPSREGDESDSGLQIDNGLKRGYRLAMGRRAAGPKSCQLRLAAGGASGMSEGCGLPFSRPSSSPLIGILAGGNFPKLFSLAVPFPLQLLFSKKCSERCEKRSVEAAKTA